MMMPPDHDACEPSSVIDDVRAARAAVARQCNGLDSLAEHLRTIGEEYRARTGQFADIPSVRPNEVQQQIDSAEPFEPTAAVPSNTAGVTAR